MSSSWFVGYTPQVSTAVMYVRGKGNEALNGYLPSFYGGDYPASTWTAVMGILMEGLDEEDFPEPVFVDGEAPEEGHAPYTPPPSPTKKAKPKPDNNKPKPTATQPAQPDPTQPEPPDPPDPDPGDGGDGGGGGEGPRESCGPTDPTC